MDTSLPQISSQFPVDLARVAQDLQIRKVQVEAVVHLLDEGNTVPFITRYRKERTGGLNEDVIRRVQHRVAHLRGLAERKQTILKSIESQGKLTDDLRAAIASAESPKRLEDLYLPYKPKKRTLATDARDRGLEPLANAIWTRDPVAIDLASVLPGMIDPDKQLTTIDDILTGVKHILAEQIAETADVRAIVRMALWDTAKIASIKSEALPEGKGLEFKDYFQFNETLRHIPAHRVLALNRGEKENALKVKLDYDIELIKRVALEPLPLADHPHRELLLTVVDDALTRLLLPSLEREIRRELTERAQDHAVAVFARNLRSLLLQRPLRGRRVLAVDPGFRTGCKLAALDETGKLLEEAVIHPHTSSKRIDAAKWKLEELIRRHQTSVIAIGNGTACRETEEFVASMITEFDARRLGDVPPPLPMALTHGSRTNRDTPTPESPAPVANSVEASHADGVSSSAAPTEQVSEPTPQEPPVVPAPPISHVPPEPLPDVPSDLAYVIVNEAGASDYSASPLGKEEFPDLDATTRGTVSIGRRLQDPLSELVKIDPQHVGVGLYQHDVHPKYLKESLEEVIESCVNHVGVDLNTASVPLLRHVSGLNQHAAREIVDYRSQHGAFRRREELKQVPSIGEARYTQAAGFLKIVGGDEPFDATWIHPESYAIAGQVLHEFGYDPGVLKSLGPDHPLREKLRSVVVEELAGKLHLVPPTVHDILDSLARPGRDPREDLPPPIFKKGVLKLEDLQPGMELKGTVLNVVDFGAFVDVGLKDSGLVHISQMANRYIKSPHEVVAVGDVVVVWVMGVDSDRRRVSLTMIAPGTERRPPDRRESRPPRGERPPRPAGQARPDGPTGDRGGRPPQRGGRPHDRQPRRGGPPTPRPEAQPVQDHPKPPPRKLPERRPPKPKPLPTLTQEKREGKAYLNTLGELEAFFKSRGGSSEPPPPKTEDVSPPPPAAPGDAPA
ncbi:MAG: Tex-like N-terminal domain-containing protein [Gemmataceae bacterium]